MTLRSIKFVGIVALFILVLGIHGSVKDIASKPHTIKYFIDTDISQEKTVELVRNIRKLQSTDFVRIYMFTPGGEAGIGLELLSAIRETKASMTLIVDTYAASMGAIILCEWHQKTEINDNAIILFHTLQLMTSNGQIALLAKDVDKQPLMTQIVYTLVHNVIKNNCRQAFTDAEWNDMWEKGTNIILSGKEYKKRMKI